jgi:hypothetical protein
VPEREDLWLRAGLRQFQVVRCVVTEHRGRFGVDVEVTSPAKYPNAFIDFVHLADGGHVPPAEFPSVGSVLDAITIDFMPDGELRLSARPSAVASSREDEEDTR